MHFRLFLLAENRTRDLLGTAYICRCNYIWRWNGKTVIELGYRKIS